MCYYRLLVPSSTTVVCDICIKLVVYRVTPSCLMISTGSHQRMQLPYNNWVQGTQRVELKAGSVGGGADDGRVTFRVAVTTSDVRGAGQCAWAGVGVCLLTSLAQLQQKPLADAMTIQGEPWHQLSAGVQSFAAGCICRWLRCTAAGVVLCKTLILEGLNSANRSMYHPAGTDANVKVVLYGDKGDTGERPLESSANDFERGKVGSCAVYCVV